MTGSDLQTCRAWCAANGMEIRTRGRGNAFEFTVYGGPDFIYKLALDYDGHNERECYERIWGALSLIIQSVRNLDAVEVEGPYEAEYYDDDDWRLYSKNGEYLTNLCKQKMSEQTARTIAAILNRECGE